MTFDPHESREFYTAQIEHLARLIRKNTDNPDEIDQIVKEIRNALEGIEKTLPPGR